MVAPGGSFLPGDLVGVVKPFEHWKMSYLGRTQKRSIVCSDSVLPGKLVGVVKPLKHWKMTLPGCPSEY